jgi:DNA ligase 1
MLLDEIVRTSRRVAATSSRRGKVQLLAGCLRALAADEVGIGVAYLAGELRQGRIGLGPAALRAAHPGAAAAAPTLEIADVDIAFEQIARTSGTGSGAERARLLSSLLARASTEEQEYLRRLVLGELRQGALAGVLADAIGHAYDVPAALVRRALLFSGDLGAVALASLTGGAPALARFGIVLFRPLESMLAQTAEDAGDAIGRLGEAAFEYKLDGARVQVHKAGDEVRVFSRRLNDVSDSVPELIEGVRALPARELVLDGEAIALRSGGAPHPFQTTMRRFGRKLQVEAMRRELPLMAHYFDCLYLDGETLIDLPSRERFRALAGAVGSGLVIPRRVTAEPAEAVRFLDAARAAGHEGLVAKALDAPYEAGHRGAGWLKLKPAHTLDLVVLAAEWGHGRRSGWLSNLHLGARDPENGGFVMLGKTFKGMTDELLAWQTRALQQIELGRDRHTVHVRPELVVEIAFDGIQASPRYPGGLALRFARLKRYRPDKRAENADTIDTVRHLSRLE